MRTIRIYQNTPLKKDITIELDRDAANHIANVLRLSVNMPLILFNGDGIEYTAKIITIKKNTASVFIEDQKNISRESSLSMHLAQGISRGEKMDLTIQKAVELGVKEITPLLTERCGVKLSQDRWQKKIAHWEKIIISACEQCGRNEFPIIHSVMPYNDFVAHDQSETKLIFNPDGQHPLNKIPKPKNDITILIGPEGGFTNNEITLAKNQSYSSIYFGPRILRTETAAIASIAAVQTLWGQV